jgi:hypothetical protein
MYRRGRRAVGGAGPNLDPPIRQAVASANDPLRGVRLAARAGPPVDADVPVDYVLATDDRLTRLAGAAAAPAAWPRAACATLAVVRAADADAWKTCPERATLLATLARCDDPGARAGGVAVVLVPPPGAATDPARAKAAARLFAALRADFSTRRLDRCVRSDAAGWQADLGRLLAAAAAAALDARAGAAADAARALAAAAADPAGLVGLAPGGWRFAPLALAKDTAAALAAASGRPDDALREYAELEALHAAAEDADSGAGSGAETAAATLTSASWRSLRSLAAAPAPPPPLAFRQAVFAQQARLLLAAGRRGDLADKGMRFVASAAPTLGARAAAGALPPLFPLAWTASACLALADAAAPPARRPSSPAPGEGDAAAPLPLGWPSFPLPPALPAPADRALHCRVGDLYAAAADAVGGVLAGLGSAAAPLAADPRLAGGAPRPLAAAAPSPSRRPAVVAGEGGHLVAARATPAAAASAFATRAPPTPPIDAAVSPGVELTSLAQPEDRDDDASSVAPSSAAGGDGDGPATTPRLERASPVRVRAAAATTDSAAASDAAEPVAPPRPPPPAAAPSLADWGGGLAAAEAALLDGESDGGYKSAASTPPGSPPRGAPAWVGDARLASALATPDASLDLWLAAVGAAVAAYALGGRPRRAACLAGGAARALAARGRAADAAAALAAHAAAAAAEGWTALQASLLPALAAAQAEAGGSGVPPSTALALLALDPALVPPAARQAACAALLAAAARDALPDNPPPPAPDARLADGSFDAGPALRARAAAGAASRLAAPASPPAPHPVLLPPAGAPGGAVVACVGDEVEVGAVVASAMPALLARAGVTLILAHLQPLAGAHGATLGASSGDAAPFALEWREVGTVAARAASRLDLPPGDTHVTARLCPLDRGLYVLKAVQVSVGCLTLTAAAAGAARVVAVAGPPTARARAAAAPRAGDRPLLTGVAQWIGIAVVTPEAGGGATVHVLPPRRGGARAGATFPGGLAAIGPASDATPATLTPAPDRGGGAVRVAAPGGGGAPPGSTTVWLWAAPDAPDPPPDATLCRLDLDVGVETDRRAATTRVSLPVAPALALAAAATPAPGGGVLLVVDVTAPAAPWPVRLVGADADAGGGARAPGAPALADGLPILLRPGGAVRLVQILPYAGTDDGAGASAAVSVSWEAAADEDGATTADDAPPPPPSTLPPSGVVTRDVDLPPPSAAAGGTSPAPAARSAPPVAVRFLGPFAAPAGAPVTLCWRLERPESPPPPADAATALTYEVRPPPGGGWLAGGARAGAVVLPAAPGAAAVVEATLTPAAAGALRAPGLALGGADARAPDGGSGAGAALVVVS